MRTVIVLAVLSALVGSGSWFLGLAVVPSITVGVAFFAVIFAIGGSPRLAQNHPWPDLPEPTPEHGTRESRNLSIALKSRGGLTNELTLSRIRTAADLALRRRHLLLDRPGDAERIDQLIGPAARTFLANNDLTIRSNDALKLLRAIEILDEFRTETHS